MYKKNKIKFDEKYRIGRKYNNLAIEKRRENNDKISDNWLVVSYHGDNLNSLISGLISIAGREHSLDGGTLLDELKKMQLEIVSLRSSLEKLVIDAVKLRKEEK